MRICFWIAGTIHGRLLPLRLTRLSGAWLLIACLRRLSQWHQISFPSSKVWAVSHGMSLKEERKATLSNFFIDRYSILRTSDTEKIWAPDGIRTHDPRCHRSDALTSELLRTCWRARVIFVGWTCEPHLASMCSYRWFFTFSFIFFYNINISGIGWLVGRSFMGETFLTINVTVWYS